MKSAAKGFSEDNFIFTATNIGQAQSSVILGSIKMQSIKILFKLQCFNHN